MIYLKKPFRISYTSLASFSKLIWREDKPMDEDDVMKKVDLAQ